MKRKLFLLAAALGVSLLSLWGPAPATALYPTCSDLYCNANPGYRCTCKGTTFLHPICSPNWRQDCSLA